MMVPYGSLVGAWFDPFVLALAALVIDLLFGDPGLLYRRVPHPVQLIGRGIGLCARALNRPAWATSARRLGGVLTVIVIVGLAATVGWLLGAGFRSIGNDLWGGALEALTASTLIAFKGLHDHVHRVAQGLARGLEAGRDAVRHIVGREADALDEAGVARSAIESAAENLSDAVVAPLFWYLILGLPGLGAYKALNTLDSMIGYRSDEFQAFGWAAARLDDLVNLIPARLTGLLLALSAAFLPGARPEQALRAMARDARHHRSPNAGWPEAAMAGALDIRLGGPRTYRHESVEQRWIGAHRDAHAADIVRALRLNRGVAGLLALGLAAIAVWRFL